MRPNFLLVTFSFLVLCVFCLSADKTSVSGIATAMALPLVTGIGCITPEMINSAKLKLGESVRLKVLTIVAEPDVLDIDKLTLEDKLSLERFGINASIVGNKLLPLEKRLVELNKLEKITAIDKPNLTGKVIEPGEYYHFLIKRPDKSLVKMFRSIDDPEKMSESLVKNLVIDGDMEALEDGLVYIEVMSKLKGIVAASDSFLSNA